MPQQKQVTHKQVLESILYYTQPIDTYEDDEGRTIYEYYETTDNGNNFRLKMREDSNFALEIIYFEFDE